MSRKLTSFQFDTIRHVIAEAIGMAVSERNRAVVEMRVFRAAARVNMPVDRFCLSVRTDEDCQNALIAELTVHETYFMREKAQLSFAVRWLKNRLQQGNAPVKVLSAGCASGEEVYSLRIVWLETASEREETLQVTGMDVSPDMIRQAQDGIYQAHSLRLLSLPELDRYFRPLEDGRFAVAETPRRHVSFECCNLLTGTIPPAAYDMILCRNLFMYLTEDARHQLLNRFHRWLRASGCLLLGTTESVRSPETRFVKRQDESVFYYERKE